ncbi:unnamed protein product [Lupinus luteus]|uniref:Uncharacterized protein n=1 Tax=Lupinus luteus TaxID=3873 RepID=A0AAV1YH34_LUPLU
MAEASFFIVFHLLKKALIFNYYLPLPSENLDLVKDMTQQQNVVVSETKSEVVAQNKSLGGGYISIRRRSILKNLEINGRVNGWIESMKASSPTHSSLSQDQTSWISYTMLVAMAWILKGPLEAQSTTK